MIPSHMTYNAMPIDSINQLTQSIARTYSNSIGIKSANSTEYIDINQLSDNVMSIDSRLMTVEMVDLGQSNILMERIHKLEEENYELTQRLDRLEMLLQEN